jgi:hypothetical protein
LQDNARGGWIVPAAVFIFSRRSDLYLSSRRKAVYCFGDYSPVSAPPVARRVSEGISLRLILPQPHPGWEFPGVIRVDGMAG